VPVLSFAGCQRFDILPIYVMSRFRDLELLRPTWPFKQGDDGLDRGTPWLSTFQFRHHDGGLVAEMKNLTGPCLDAIRVIGLNRSPSAEQIHVRSSIPCTKKSETLPSFVPVASH
jgi:hypothetical protein